VALIIRSAAAGDAATVAALIDAMGGHDGAAGNPAVDAVDHEALGWPGCACWCSCRTDAHRSYRREEFEERRTARTDAR
jgi:hypothetical protein